MKIFLIKLLQDCNTHTFLTGNDWSQTHYFHSSVSRWLPSKGHDNSFWLSLGVTDFFMTAPCMSRSLLVMATVLRRVTPCSGSASFQFNQVGLQSESWLRKLHNDGCLNNSWYCLQRLLWDFSSHLTQICGSLFYFGSTA